ncbi:MAG: transcription termination/antitermination protein NusA [Muribaculaceae bacterium]|nr:transcription termination/antitermination protein NusA [Muribaculaceae bacterium]
MAKKKEDTIGMVEQFAQFKEDKSIDMTTLISVLEDSFRTVLGKMFGTDTNFDVVMNPDKGDVQIFQNLEVVPDDEVVNPNLQISLSDARADNDPDVEIGEEHVKEIIFEKFGRRAILNLRQTLQTKISDMQKKSIYEKFQSLEGEIVCGEVYQTWSRETLLLDEDKAEMILPKSESIPGDFFHKGDIVKAVVKVVENENKPKVTLSRTSNLFLRRLFEQEVPEIHDGLVTICGVARIPGLRAKVAVQSFDDHIDPVGSCVGQNGSRVRGIVHELHNESIDVIHFTTNPNLFIQRALSPAKISSMRIDEKERKAEVFIKPENIAEAIGTRGANIKLAIMITGYEIEVYRDDFSDEEDIYLEDFKDEIAPWVIDQLKCIGCVTAKSVLNTPRQELIDRADLEEETVDEVLRILNAEFED